MRHSGASCGAPASRGAPREECDDRVFQLHLLRADAGIDRPGFGLCTNEVRLIDQ